MDGKTGESLFLLLIQRPSPYFQGLSRRIMLNLLSDYLIAIEPFIHSDYLMLFSFYLYSFCIVFLSSLSEVNMCVFCLLVCFFLLWTGFWFLFWMSTSTQINFLFYFCIWLIILIALFDQVIIHSVFDFERKKTLRTFKF